MPRTSSGVNECNGDFSPTTVLSPLFPVVEGTHANHEATKDILDARLPEGEIVLNDRQPQDWFFD